MFWAFRLSFDVDFWLLGALFGYFSKNWAIFSQASGHTNDHTFGNLALFSLCALICINKMMSFYLIKSDLSFQKQTSKS
jgi:hypothetical protein